MIADRAFAWQGKYNIELRSRVVDDTRSESRDLIAIPVIIDSVAPTVFEDRVAFDGTDLVVPARDLVSKDALSWAYARPGDAAPATEWFTTDRVARSTIAHLLEHDAIQVFVRDEAGNVQNTIALPFHGQPGESGCNCDATGGPGAGCLLGGDRIGFEGDGVVGEELQKGLADPLLQRGLRESALGAHHGVERGLAVDGLGCGGSHDEAGRERESR